MHRNHLVQYHPEEETPPPMVEECVRMNRHYDNLYERFMGQRIQKLNHSEQPCMADSLPLTIELLRTAPVTLPQKRVSNTSSDSGVNCPHVLSPATPIPTDNSQPHLLQSISRMNPPTGPLASIPHFIKNSRKSKNKETKDNCSQPDYLDLQSVSQTRTRQGYKL